MTHVIWAHVRTRNLLEQRKELEEGNHTKGWSYRRIFAEHLKGARQITISDPYVRAFYQVRNVMEFLQMVHELVPDGDEVRVALVTQSDRENAARQEDQLNQIVGAFGGSKVTFSWRLDQSPPSTPAALPPIRAGRSASTVA